MLTPLRPSSELPVPDRSRQLWSSLLVAIAVLVDLAAAVMLHATFGTGTFADDAKRWLAARDLALPATLTAAALALLLTLIAYLSTLDWQLRRRPAIRLFALGFGLAIVGLVPLLGVLSFPVEQPLVLGATLVLALMLALLVWPLEWMIGRLLGSVAALSAASRSPQAAYWGRQALRFSPSNCVARRAFGLGLAYAGNTQDAYPHLIHAYSLGDRTAPLLRALADVTEKTGELTTALNHLEELAAILPHDEQVLADRIRLNRELQRPADARALIEAIEPERRLAWREVRLELLMEMADCPALLEESRAFEAEEGPPFRRAREILRQVRAFEPEKVEHLDQLIRLADLAADSDELRTLLEQAIAIRPDDDTLLRKLRQELLAAGETVRAAELLHQIGKLGRATEAEYLELAAVHADMGDHEGLIRMLSMLDGAPSRTARGALLIVRNLFESGRHEEALQEAEKARQGGWLVGAPADEVAAIESRIRAQALSSAIADLGRQALADPTNIDLQFQYMERLSESGALDKVVLHGEQLLSKMGEEVLPRLESELARCVELSPQGRSGRLLEYLGDLRLRMGDSDGALKYYREASRLSMNPDKALLEMARRILGSDPDHYPSHIVAAELELKADEPRAALRHLDRALELGYEMQPGTELQLLEFQAAAKIGLAARAIAAGQALINHEAYRDRVDLHLQLAELLMTQGLYDQAAHLLEQLHQRMPDDMTVRGRMRHAFERRKVARIERLRTELTLHPRSAEILEELGDLLLADGKINEAVVEYQKAAHVGPEFRRARAKLGFCLARKGLHAESEEAYSEIDLQPSLPPEELNYLKDLFYDGALLMEKDRESDRALGLYKRISRVDMGFRDVLARIERLTRSQRRRINN